jgi:hypothetical protein
MPVGATRSLIFSPSDRGKKDIMEPISNPFSVTRTPQSVELPNSYRDGKFQVVTFENEQTHLCYSLDEAGAVWDFCSIGERVVHFEGKLSEAELARARVLADEFSVTE